MSPVRDPFATAVVTGPAAPGCGWSRWTMTDCVRWHRGFDTLFPMTGSLDDTVAGVVERLSARGTTVVLVTTADMAAAHRAGITIGITRGSVPPWGADLFVPDLPAVWRILRAMPAARAASNRGVQLSLSSSAIGALMLIPGVPGYGPEAVNAGVLGGLWAGFNAGSRVFGETLPAPEPGHDWYALPAAEVQRLLPRPPPAPGEPAVPPNPLFAPARLAGRVPRRPPGRWPVSSPARCAPAWPTRSPRSWPPARWPAPSWARRWTPRWSAACCWPTPHCPPSSSCTPSGCCAGCWRCRTRWPAGGRSAGRPAERRRHRGRRGRRAAPGDLIEIHAGGWSRRRPPHRGRQRRGRRVHPDRRVAAGAQGDGPDAGRAAGRAFRHGLRGHHDGGGHRAGGGDHRRARTEMHRAMALAPTKGREIGLQRQLARITSRALPWSLAGGAAVGLFSVLRGTRCARRSAARWP